AAARELERPDSRVPVEGAVRGEVLVRVPECAVVGRIDTHARVVAPAAEGGRLRAVAVDDRPLALRHHAERIAREPPGVVDSRMEAGARDAEAERDVAVL